MPSEVWEALERGDADALERLLRQRPELAGSRDEVGVSLLLGALYRRRNDLAGLVLSANPPLDGFDASALDDVSSLDELLVADPDFPHKRAGDGFTALHLAAFFRAERAAARLLDAGADPNAVAGNTTRVQPLHSAAAARAVRIARLLLARGADVNASHPGGYTPLQAAAQVGDAELVTLLLEAGADPLLANDEGLTALDLAEREGHERVAAALRSA